MHIVLGIIIAAIVLLLLLPVKAVASYSEKRFFVKAYVWKVPVYKYIPKQKNKADKKDTVDKVRQTEKAAVSLGEKIEHFSEIYSKATNLARKYLKIENISLNAEIGTGEAPSTAICTGLMWSTIYSLIGKIGSIIYIDSHNVQINPAYDGKKFSVDGECIIKSRIVYIIFIAITILIKINSRKGKEE